MERVVLFGTGGFCKKNIDKVYFKNMEIIAFIDNDISKIGNRFENKIIFSPQEINNLDYEKVIIMSMFSSEMAMQLIKLNVPENKICVYEEYSNEFKNSWQIYNLVNYKQYVESSSSKKILLITHELSLTGAPMALKYQAQALKEEGYMPIIISPKNGPLINEFLKLGISVIISPILCMESSNFKRLVKISKLIVVNTLIMYCIVEELSNLKIPVIWWLHEGKFLYEIYEKKIPKNLGKNINVYIVGEYAQIFWSQLGISIVSKILLYGIPDKLQYYKSKKCKSKDKIIFSIIGTIEKRKGQDIFIKAIQTLSKEYRKKAEFWIIGKSVDLNFKRKLITLADNIEEVKFIDEMKNNSIFDVYSKSSILVSASRDDPMPIVLAEGMMMKKPCICSSNTGTASLIENWKNGIVFQSEDYIKLGNIMMKIIDNPNLIENMKKNSRTTYEKTFMYSTFKKNLIYEVQKFIK